MKTYLTKQLLHILQKVPKNPMLLHRGLSKSFQMMTCCLITFLVSCEEFNDVASNSEEFYTVYELTYHEVDDRTEACASLSITNNRLFDPDEQIILDENSYVSFNDYYLADSYGFLEGPNPYCRNFDGVVRHGTFLLDYEGIYRNEISLPPAIDFSNDEDIINGANYELVWDGAPLSAGEEIIVRITDRRGNSVKETISGPVNANSIMISGTSTVNLSKGIAGVLIIREIESNTISTPESGHIISRYQAVGFINVQ